MQNITTKRLILSLLTIEDFEDIFTLCANEQVMRYIYGGPYSATITEQKINWWLNHFKQHGFGLWTIRLHHQQQKIGVCGLLLQHFDHQECVEIGYRLLPAYWGQGIATEAAKAIQALAHHQHGIESLIATIHPQNQASIHVAAKLGMEFERTWQMMGTEILIYQQSLHHYHTNSHSENTHPQ